jgi:hypothetical protein
LIAKIVVTEIFCLSKLGQPKIWRLNPVLVAKHPRGRLGGKEMSTSDLMDEINMSRGYQHDDKHKNLASRGISDNHGRTAFVQPSSSLNELYHVVNSSKRSVEQKWSIAP